ETCRRNGVRCQGSRWHAHLQLIVHDDAIDLRRFLATINPHDQRATLYRHSRHVRNFTTVTSEHLLAQLTALAIDHGGKNLGALVVQGRPHDNGALALELLYCHATQRTGAVGDNRFRKASFAMSLLLLKHHCFEKCSYRGATTIWSRPFRRDIGQGWIKIADPRQQSVP